MGEGGSRKSSWSRGHILWTAPYLKMWKIRKPSVACTDETSTSLASINGGEVFAAKIWLRL